MTDSGFKTVDQLAIPVGTEQFQPEGSPSRISRLGNRGPALLLCAAYCFVGILFMLYWNPLIRHVSSWNTGGDLWGIFRGAHYVGWGFPGGIYTDGTGIVTFPGMATLLAPVAMLASHFHLTESYAQFVVARPTAALILQPIELILASTVIVACDALAERLSVSARRRFFLCLTVGIVAFPVAAVWGHAEDALTMTFAIYAMVAMLDRRYAAMGWLLGFGIVIQPLVALMLPLLLGATPRGHRAILAVRSFALSTALIVVAFLGDASDTYRALVKQPTPPAINHATPWTALAPKVTSGSGGTVHSVAIVPGLGHAAITAVTSTSHAAVMVAGGPGRAIDVVLALSLGVYVWRRPQPTNQLLWLAALVLASRCFFEPVMTPYYLAPPLFLCLVMASRQRAKRFWPAVVIALEITVFAYHHLNPWVWWLTVVAGLVAILALGYPGHLNAGPVASAPVSDARAGLEGDGSSDESEVVEGQREPALL